MIQSQNPILQKTFLEDTFSLVSRKDAVYELSSFRVPTLQPPLEN